MNTQTIQSLEAKKSELVNALRADYKNHDKLIGKINAVEADIKQARRIEKLQSVNAEQARKREAARIVWECEVPETDITCNDGSFHSTKVKKYPKLAALTYGRGKFEGGVLLEISTGSERFTMYHAKYEYNKPTVYTRFASFEEFLEFNGVMSEDMSLEQYEAIIAKVEAMNAEFKAAVDKFDKQKDALNLYRLSSFGLFSQQHAGHIYEYSPAR